MTTQTELFPGEYYRDAGIKKAVDHADETEFNWSVQAYSFLLIYIKSHDNFMCEDIRLKSCEAVPWPPSARAWGGVIRRAAKAGLIKRIGFKNVKNVKAHCTPATVWETVSKEVFKCSYCGSEIENKNDRLCVDCWNNYVNHV